MTSNDDPSDRREENGKDLCFYVGESFHSRLTNHIRTLKYLGRLDRSKHDWMVDAVREKLKREREHAHSFKSIPVEKSIHISLDEELKSELENRIALIKKFTAQTYSTKKWVLEALQEKIEREEALTREFADQLRPTYEK